MQGEKTPAPEALIVVASRWPEFLRRSQAMLVAAGLDPESLIFRDARKRGWEKGLKSAAFVICDSLTARQLPPDIMVRIFPIMSDSSLAELRAYVERFFD